MHLKGLGDIQKALRTKSDPAAPAPPQGYRFDIQLRNFPGESHKEEDLSFKA